MPGTRQLATLPAGAGKHTCGLPSMSHGEQLVSAVLEFLEAAIHTVLKSRNIYSPSLFENRRLYGISVSQCRHPGVCSYIGTVLGNLRVGVLQLVGKASSWCGPPVMVQCWFW
jgi:hypothetical protein